MKFIATVEVMPHPEILDPQGKAVKLGLANLGFANVQDVRVGKHIVLRLETETEQQAEQEVKNACEKLLANLTVETYTFALERLD